MEKKQYTAPCLTIVDMESTTILAGSDGLSKDGSNGNLGSGVENNGDASQAFIPSQKFFDSWDDNADEDYE